MIREQKKKNKTSEKPIETIYFTTTDPEDRIITLKEERWKHIKDHHPEVDRPSTIKNTVKKPDIILESERKRNELIYTVKTESNLYFNVITQVEGEYPYPEGGTVSTAHYTRKLLRGVSIWAR